MAQWCIPCSIQLSGRIIVKKYGCGERICGKRDQDKPLRRCEVGRSVSRRLAASNNVGYPYLPSSRGIVDHSFCFVCDQYVWDRDHLIEERIAAGRVPALPGSKFQILRFIWQRRCHQ